MRRKLYALIIEIGARLDVTLLKYIIIIYFINTESRDEGKAIF